MPYQFAENYNNAAGLTTIDPQPAFSGVLVMEERFPISGDAVETGMRYGVFRYSGITPEQYEDLLTAFDLLTNKTRKGTFRILADPERDTFSNWNGIVVRPANPRFEGGFYYEIEFRIRYLRAI